jgi:hypothetical protein
MSRLSSLPYPIVKSQTVSIKKFCEQLPIPTSHETPLVFYTFSLFNNHNAYVPTIYMPEVKPIIQYNDVAATCEWSKDNVGFFFYVKKQLIDYQHILQTAQCSTTTVQQHLKTKLLEFLCSIRSKLITFRAIEELKNILDEIDNTSGSGSTTPNHASPVNVNQAMATSTRSATSTTDVPSIGFSHLFNSPPTNEPNHSAGKCQLCSCRIDGLLPFVVFVKDQHVYHRRVRRHILFSKVHVIIFVHIFNPINN